MGTCLYDTISLYVIIPFQEAIDPVDAAYLTFADRCHIVTGLDKCKNAAGRPFSNSMLTL